MFKSKILLITGGTGSFGNAVLKTLLNSDIKEIRIFSRDEKKQDDMRKHYGSEKIKFYIGDVRDIHSINAAMNDVDFVFHAAALKQVPSCEFYPIEAVKTNILGTENVLQSARHYGVSRVVVLSTDKAVYPINAMGISKAMMEKVAVSSSRLSDQTIVNVTRYGNVMCSRGSVIPLFIKQIKSGSPITITDPNMTRFMMTLDDAVSLVLFAFEHGKPGEIFVQKSPASTIGCLSSALVELFNVPNYPVDLIGTRHGEKLFEVLLSREEMACAVDLGEYYCVPPDLRDLNYEKFVNEGETRITESAEYTSHNTRRLTLDSMQDLLKSVPYVQSMLDGITSSTNTSL